MSKHTDALDAYTALAGRSLGSLRVPEMYNEWATIPASAPKYTEWKTEYQGIASEEWTAEPLKTSLTVHKFIEAVKLAGFPSECVHIDHDRGFVSYQHETLPNGFTFGFRMNTEQVDAMGENLCEYVGWRLTTLLEETSAKWQ